MPEGSCSTYENQALDIFLSAFDYFYSQEVDDRIGKIICDNPTFVYDHAKAINSAENVKKNISLLPASREFLDSNEPSCSYQHLQLKGIFENPHIKYLFMAYDEVTEYANNKKIPDILRPQLFHQCCGHTMHSDSCIDDTVLERNEICADDSKIIAEIYTDDSNAEKFITGEEQNEIDARLQDDPSTSFSFAQDALKSKIDNKTDFINFTSQSAPKDIFARMSTPLEKEISDVVASTELELVEETKYEKKIIEADEKVHNIELHFTERKTLWCPSENQIRCVVLIGPRGVGRTALKKRLVASSEKYRHVIPTTSRKPRKHEFEAIDYYFTNRDDMLKGILEGKFIEFGEYNGNLYGTKYDSVAQVIDNRRIPVLNIHPSAIEKMRSAQFKPIILFIKPPDMLKLKQTRCNSSTDAYFTDHDLKQMIANAAQLEQTYGHYFDATIENYIFEETFSKLCSLLLDFHTKPSSVPSSWTE
ncbi:guanylate kinase domain-containing protein [Ditylenchus destructor]|uniref:Guanylate kinase domain-containing protein n=1 Tax=Ditylenchus destructor TaxID=166010 RepID=A0AAD4NGL4_9BILA|nr:guanylate kinase domain-containing protein [Ditylenchus destructor]